MTEHPYIPSMSQTTALLVEYLVSKARNGETSLSYSELENLTGLSRTNGLVSKLSSARRHIQNRHAMVWDVERGQGLRLLSDAEKVKLGRNHVTKSRRAVNRAEKVIRTADAAKLQQAERQQYDLTLAQANIVKSLLSTRNEHKFQGVMKNHVLPDKTAVLEAFK